MYCWGSSCRNFFSTPHVNLISLFRSWKPYNGHAAAGVLFLSHVLTSFCSFACKNCTMNSRCWPDIKIRWERFGLETKILLGQQLQKFFFHFLYWPDFVFSLLKTRPWGCNCRCLFFTWYINMILLFRLRKPYDGDCNYKCFFSTPYVDLISFFCSPQPYHKRRSYKWEKQSAWFKD